jgi:hypothetical protein
MGGNLDTRSGVGWQPSRYLHPTSRLGFHAPALVLPEGQFSREDVQRAYGVAIEAVGLISEKANKLRIAQPLLTQMFTNVGDSFHYVDTVDGLASYGFQLYGYGIPTMSDAASRSACWNAFRWHYRGNDPLESLEDFMAFVGSFRTQSGLTAFDPFDGTMLCKHEVQQLGGGDVDRVTESEWNDLRDPHFDRSWPQWIRYPGPMPLNLVAPGTTRDF